MDEPHTLPVKPKHRNQHPPAVTKAKQTQYLTALIATGSHSQACKAANCGMSSATDWAAANIVFAKRLSDAREKAEKNLLLRYEDSLDETVLNAVSIEDFAKVQNSRFFRMKRLDPRYRDNAVLAINATGPVAMQLNFNASPQLTQADTQAEAKP